MRHLAALVLLTALSTGCAQKCGVAVASEEGNAVFTWTCDTIDAIEVIADDEPGEVLWHAWSDSGPLTSPLAYGELTDESMQEAAPAPDLNKDTFYRVTIFDCRDGEAGQQDCRYEGWGAATFEWVD